MLPAVYFSCPTVVHTATENWKPQFVLVTGKGIGVLSTVYSIPPISWLGMWFWHEKLGTGTGSWPSCLAHWSAVDSPPKTPENSVPSAARWLPSILFVLQSVKMALWYGNRHNAASRSSQEWGQHLARGFSCTHRARWRVGGSSTGIHRERSSAISCMIPIGMNQLPQLGCLCFPLSSGWREA